MKKELRQEKILELVDKHNIANQKELMDWLLKEGIKTTQATISRDIKDLQLIKVPDQSGESFLRSRLTEPEVDFVQETEDYFKRVETIFKESVTDIVSNNFLIIIKTLPGMAQAAAHAIDTIDLEEILGTIAGDDTIFVALKDGTDIDNLLFEFKLLMNKE